jgi:hypothetical protein
MIVYVEDLMKPGGELVQGTLYASVELSQWNPLVLLMYANEKIV